MMDIYQFVFGLFSIAMIVAFVAFPTVVIVKVVGFIRNTTRKTFLNTPKRK